MGLFSKVFSKGKKTDAEILGDMGIDIDPSLLEDPVFDDDLDGLDLDGIKDGIDVDGMNDDEEIEVTAEDFKDPALLEGLKELGWESDEEQQNESPEQRLITLARLIEEGKQRAKEFKGLGQVKEAVAELRNVKALVAEKQGLEATQPECLPSASACDESHPPSVSEPSCVSVPADGPGPVPKPRPSSDGTQPLEPAETRLPGALSESLEPIGAPQTAPEAPAPAQAPEFTRPLSNPTSKSELAAECDHVTETQLSASAAQNPCAPAEPVHERGPDPQAAPVAHSACDVTSVDQPPANPAVRPLPTSAQPASEPRPMAVCEQVAPKDASAASSEAPVSSGTSASQSTNTSLPVEPASERQTAPALLSPSGTPGGQSNADRVAALDGEIMTTKRKAIALKREGKTQEALKELQVVKQLEAARAALQQPGASGAAPPAPAAVQPPTCPAPTEDRDPQAGGSNEERVRALEQRIADTKREAVGLKRQGNVLEAVQKLQLVKQYEAERATLL